MELHFKEIRGIFFQVVNHAICNIGSEVYVFEFLMFYKIPLTPKPKIWNENLELRIWQIRGRKLLWEWLIRTLMRYTNYY